MKQLIELESWCNNVISEKTLGQPSKSIGDRPLPRSQDIMYQAQRKYPDRSPDQALSLFINDEMEQNKNMDFEQNKLINAQKRENEKLRRSLQDLSDELHGHEQTAMDTEREVQRLRDLSAKLKPAGELQQQAVKASQEQVQKMLNDLDQIKTKPGIDDAKIKELEQKIMQAQEGSTQKQVQQLEKVLADMSVKSSINDKYFDAVSKRLSDIENQETQRQSGLEKRLTDFETRKMTDFEKKIENVAQQLDAKEERFKKYIKKTGQKLRQAEQEAENTVADLQKANDVALKQIMYLKNKLSGSTAKARPTALTKGIQQHLDQPSHDQDVFDFMNQEQPTPMEPDNLEDFNTINLGEPPDLDQGREDLKAAISQAMKKHNRDKPMNEQYDDEWDENYIETELIPILMRRFHALYPLELKRYSVEQLRAAINRWVRPELLFYGDDALERVDPFLQSIRNFMHRSMKPSQPELPAKELDVVPPSVSKPKPITKIDWPPGPDAVSESIDQFEKDLTILTNGY